MKKQITTIILFVLYLLSQSGLVIFAFDCHKSRHTHYAINKQVTCNDFEDKHCNKTSCCDCASHSNDAKLLFKNYGHHTDLTFLLDIDVDRVVSEDFSFTNNALFNFLNYINLNTEQNNNSKFFTFLCKRLNFKYKEHSQNHSIITYIHNTTSKKSDDYHIC